MPEKDYSFRSPIDKLNVKEGARVLVPGVKDAALLAEIRARTQHLSKNRKQRECDVILLGVESVADLGQIESCQALMAGAGGLWVIYPKGRKDITEAQVRAAGLATGMVDNKVIGFSATHTGLRFVTRKADRPLVFRAGKTEDEAGKGEARG
jgi:hypothetical protein